MLQSLADESIRDVSTGRFRWTNDLHDLSSLKTEVSCHGIASLDAHQHVFLEFVTGEELLLFFWSHHDVFWDQLVFGDIDEKL